MTNQDNSLSKALGDHPLSDGEDLPQRPQPMAAPDNIGSSTARPADQEEVLLADLFTLLEADLDSTAQDILDDNFAADGISYIAILFGRMQAADGRNAGEIWAKFLGLTRTLWSAGYLDATYKLLGDADLRLSPPDVYAEQLRASRDYAEDYIIAERIKTRFEEGDDEGARGLVSKLSEDNRKAIEDGLKTDIKMRKMMRRRTFIFAGVFGVVLLGANVMGLRSLYGLFQNPPDFTLREFSVPEDYPLRPEAIHEALRDDVEQLQSPNLPDNAPSQTSVPVLDPEGVSIPTPLPEAVLPAPVTVPDEIETPLEAPADATFDEMDPEQVYNCALAERIIERGHEIARDRDSLSALQRIQDFKTTTEKACSGLTISEADLAEVGRGIPNGRVNTLAEGILSSD